MAAIVKPSERGLNDYQSHVSESAEIGWFGPRGVSPHWFDPKEKQRKLCLMFNAGESAVDFQLPHMLTTSQWYLVADTSRESPFDLCAPSEESLYEDRDDYHLHPRSSVILKAQCKTAKKTL
jgi:pullulanase/glycogen debranching enzyme